MAFCCSMSLALSHTSDVVLQQNQKNINIFIDILNILHARLKFQQMTF